MNSRERLRAALECRVPDRVPMTEISGYWPETLSRWHKEGLPENTDPITYFELDRIFRLSFDALVGLEEKVISETEEKIVLTNRDGTTLIRWKNKYAPSLPLDFPVKTEKDWLRIRGYLRPDEKRLGKNFIKKYEEYEENGGFILLSQREPCWNGLAALMGVRNFLITMIKKPELAYDIIETYTDLLIGMHEIMLEKGVKIDGIFLRGDLAYKNGMLFSPRLYHTLLYPHHKRLNDYFKSNKIPTIHHIDGDVRQYIPLIINSGFNAIQPLEARANNDIRELKDMYGTKICFIGNISAEALSGSKEQVEAEVRRKVLKAKVGGGYIYHSDHSVPPTISWKNYSFAIKIAKEVGKY